MDEFEYVEFLRENASDKDCLVYKGVAETTANLIERVDKSAQNLRAAGVQQGDVAILFGDYSPLSVSALLAMIEMAVIVAPATRESRDMILSLGDTIRPDWIVEAHGDEITIEKQTYSSDPHDFFAQLKEQKKPGLVLLTSGSTGTPKVVVHDFDKLLKKFSKTRTAVRTINFLMFDHWGGLNTLFHCLASQCVVVFPTERKPDYICSLIETHGVELLPSTPTFLNMLVLSRAYERFDLSSLRLITYGAEPMPESTLAALRSVFPSVELRQTYGLIELGVLQAKSKSSDSLWVKIGGSGYDIRIVDDLLEIKAESAMLGYLNAPSPFTEDGYFMTGDRVECADGYFRILGRDSDLINVGGQKVFPAEVETVLLEHPQVTDAVVYGQKNPIMGQIVCAAVRVDENADTGSLKKALTTYSIERLEKFKVPVKFQITTDALHRDRFKRIRHWN